MSQENIELVQAAMAAYFDDDEAALRELITPDVMVTTRPDQPDVSDSYGYEAFVAGAQEWADTWHNWSLEVLRISDERDYVFLEAHQSGEGVVSGVPIEDDVTFVCTVHDGRIARLQMFASEQEARAALGLSQ